MLKIGIYSIYDEKGGRYDTPFFCPNDLFAERHFIMMLKNKGTIASNFKDDMVLEKIGEFETETGKVDNGNKKRIVEGKQINMEVYTDEISNGS